MKKQSKLMREVKVLTMEEQVAIGASLREAVAPIIMLMDEAKKLYALADIENTSLVDLYKAIKKAKPSPQLIVFLMREAEEGAKKKIDESISIQNSKNSSNIKKALPTKEVLESLKKEYQENYLKEHGITIDRGWKKYAKERLFETYGSIDNKSVKLIMEGRRIKTKRE